MKTSTEPISRKRSRSESSGPSDESSSEEELIDALDKDETVALATAVVKKMLRKRKRQNYHSARAARMPSFETRPQIPELIRKYNNIMGGVIDEAGFEAVTENTDIVRFDATVSYPNDVTLDLQRAVLTVPGSAWVTYEASGPRKMRMSIFSTENRAIQLQNDFQIAKIMDERNRKAIQNTVDLGDNEGGMLIRSLMKYVMLDSSKKPPNTIHKKMSHILSAWEVSALVMNPTNGADLEMFAQHQRSKFCFARIGPDSIENQCRLTVQITSGHQEVVVQLSTLKRG